MPDRKPFCPSSSVLAAILCTTLLLSGCGRKFGPTITVKWRDPKPGIAVKTPVKYLPPSPDTPQAVDVGEVRKLLPESGNRDFQVGLYRKTAHYVTAGTTFLFRDAKGDQPAFIEAKPLNKDAPAVKDGDILQGSESDLEAKLKMFSADWMKTGLFLLIGIAVLALLVVVVKIIFHNLAMVVCIIGGGACAVWFGPVAREMLQPLLPEGIPPDIAGYAAAFLAGYIACAVVIAILRAPFRKPSPGDQGSA